MILSLLNQKHRSPLIKKVCLSHSLSVLNMPRIIVIALLWVTAFFWSGCDAQEKPKNPGKVGGGTKSKKEKIVKKALKQVRRPAGNPKKKKRVPTDNVPRPLPPANPPQPPPAPLPPREESMFEKIEKVRTECLKKLESEIDLVSLRLENVYEKDIEIMTQYHDCFVKMGKLMADEDSASFAAWGAGTLRKRMIGKINVLHKKFDGKGDPPMTHLEELETAGDEIATQLDAVSPSRDVLEKSSSRETTLKIFIFCQVVGNSENYFKFPQPNYAALKRVKERLEATFAKNMKQFQNINWIYYGFELVLTVFTDERFPLSFHQRKGVMKSSANFVQGILSKIDKSLPQNDAGKLFLQLGDFYFIGLFLQAFSGPERTPPVPDKHREIETAETSLLTTLFQKLITAYDAKNAKDAIDNRLQPVIDQGKKELDTIMGKDKTATQSANHAKNLYDAVMASLSKAITAAFHSN